MVADIYARTIATPEEVAAFLSEPLLSLSLRFQGFLSPQHIGLSALSFIGVAGNGDELLAAWRWGHVIVHDYRCEFPLVRIGLSAQRATFIRH
jgi:hypothetical protein